MRFMRCVYFRMVKHNYNSNPRAQNNSIRSISIRIRIRVLEFKKNILIFYLFKNLDTHSLLATRSASGRQCRWSPGPGFEMPWRRVPCAPTASCSLILTRVTRIVCSLMCTRQLCLIRLLGKKFYYLYYLAIYCPAKE